MSGIETNQEARDIGRLARDLRNRLWKLNDDKTVLKECRSYFDSAGAGLRVIDNSLALSLYDLRIILEEFTTGRMICRKEKGRAPPRREPRAPLYMGGLAGLEPRHPDTRSALRVLPPRRACPSQRTLPYTMTPWERADRASRVCGRTA